MSSLPEQKALFEQVFLLDTQYLSKQELSQKSGRSASLISVVRVMMNKDELAVEVGAVVETIVYKKPLSLPRSFDWVLGVIELRGEVIPVIDYSCFANKGPLDITNNSRLLIVRHEGMVFALLVSRVLGMLNIPEISSRKKGGVIMEQWINVKEQRFSFLDLKALLNNNDFLKLTY